MATTGYKTDANSPFLNKFDFYSGSQITVWFGNIWIDDITSIQWSRSQNKMPIYGYASQNFDTVANGVVSVQGSFTVNFRQRGYIPAVMGEIKSLYRDLLPDSPEAKRDFTKSQWPVVREMISLHLKNGTFGPKSISEIQDIGKSDGFFELAKVYEDVIWGQYEKKFKDQPLCADVIQSQDIPDGFNILISYGNPSSKDTSTMTEKLRSTAKSIIGVHLIGESQYIHVGGQPIQEQYAFIAKSIDDYIGTTRQSN